MTDCQLYLNEPTIETADGTFNLRNLPGFDVSKAVFEESPYLSLNGSILTVEYEGDAYILLSPAEPMEDLADDEVMILRIETDDEGNEVYETVDADGSAVTTLLQSVVSLLG